jgi:hypothetical protein
MLDRGIQEFLDLSEIHDFIKLAIDLITFHAQDGTAQVDVFPSRQFRMKTGAHLQQ